MDPDAHASDVDKRMAQLRAVCDLLRCSGSPASGDGLREGELRKAASYVDKLAAALDRGLEKQRRAALARAACAARDLRAAGKLNECVGGLMSAGALSDGLASTKPYSRQQQTIWW